MNKNAIKLVNSKSLIVYKECDHRSRQHFVVRHATGRRTFECRRFKSLVKYLSKRSQPVKVYDELPSSIREILDNLRAQQVKKDYNPPAPPRLTIGDLMLKSALNP